MADKEFDYRELGVTGLNRSGGYVYEETKPEFQGSVWRRSIQEMETDPIIGAMLFVIEMLIRRVIWTIKPSSDNPADVEVADFVTGCLDDMTPTWGDTLAEILTMLPHGWAYHEIVYKRRLGNEPPSTSSGAGIEGTAGEPVEPDYVPPPSQFDDNRIGWHRWGGRAQNTLLHWEFNRKGDILGMVQIAPPDYKMQFIPASKAMLFRTTMRYNNPEGRSILRGAYSSWYFKNNLQRIEAIGIERDLAGLPVAYVPPELLSTTASADQKAVLGRIKDIITNIRRDEQEGVIWPLAYDPESGKPLFDLKLLSTGGTRQFNTEQIIARYDQRIAMSVIADFILVGHESVGAYSLSQDKTDLFFTAIEAWLDAIADLVNRKAIPDLLKLNGYKLENPPKLTHGEIRKISLAEIGDYLSKISGAGMILPDKELENYLRAQANLPLVPPDEEREYALPTDQGDQTGLDMKGNPKGGAKPTTNQPSKVTQTQRKGGKAKPGQDSSKASESNPNDDLSSLMMKTSEPLTPLAASRMSQESALAILQAASRTLGE